MSEHAPDSRARQQHELDLDDPQALGCRRGRRHRNFAILTTLNGDLAQGYLISRSLEPAAMTTWLKNQPAQPALAHT
jgi:hypothetical protein